MDAQPLRTMTQAARQPDTAYTRRARWLVLAGGWRCVRVPVGRACRWLFLGRAGSFPLHTPGVLNAASGYAGGQSESARSERVVSGQTGQAESAQVSQAQLTPLKPF
ncbi:hypothetical protein IWX85_003610 [Polaromonas sp. CG_9.11]|nr:hypothetical protein [Polaromonas sp. CG_9.11]